MEKDFYILSECEFYLGCFLAVLATVGRLWCAQYIAGYKDGVLVTEGPYSVTRNPLYFFSFMGGMGAGFATETILLPAVIFAGFLMIYPATIRAEEKKLSLMFGDAYRAYAASVPRFFPKLSLFREPEEYVIKTKTYRRAGVEAMLFVWIIILFEIFEELGETGAIPALFSIY
ncbi:MAG: isoprenylcysteine carboxylmethyltransferase family protein [Deltaproteobacteria bacterium]|nr:isoprenylcysteine carboxylmethyltransferase family protein [Deltaproteobacteria bacterium]